MEKVKALPYFQIFKSRIVPKAFDHFRNEHPFPISNAEEIQSEILKSLNRKSEEEKLTYLKDQILNTNILLHDYLSNLKDHLKSDELNFDARLALSRNPKDPFIEGLLNQKVSGTKTLNDSLRLLTKQLLIEKVRIKLCHYLVNAIKTESLFGVCLSRLSSKFKVITNSNSYEVKESDISQVQILIFLFSEFMANAYLNDESINNENQKRVLIRKGA